MHEHCNTSTSSPTLGVASLFTLCQASRCLVVYSLNSENTRTHTYTHVSFLLIVVTYTFSHIYKCSLQAQGLYVSHHLSTNQNNKFSTIINNSMVNIFKH